MVDTTNLKISTHWAVVNSRKSKQSSYWQHYYPSKWSMHYIKVHLHFNFSQNQISVCTSKQFKKKKHNSPQQPSRTHSSALYFLSFSSRHRHLHLQDPCHASCHSWSGCSVDGLPYQHRHMAVCIRGPVSDSHFNTNGQTMKIIRSGLQVRPWGLNLNSFTYQTYKKYTVRHMFSNSPVRPTPS